MCYSVHVDLAVEEICARPAGAVARRQILAAGGSDKMISARLRSGRFRRTGCQGVYLIVGAPPTYRQRLWVAHLAAGDHSVVSHEAAAALVRLSGFARDQVVLTVDHPSHLHVRGAFVHQISDLQPRWVWRVEGLPVTTTARTIVDLSSVCSRARLGHVIDDALAKGRVRQSAIAACLCAVLRPGKRGLDKLVAVLDQRGEGYVPPMSELEACLFAALADAGLPDPVRQFPLPGRGAVTGLVDAAYLEERVILEADGRSWHDRIQTARRDLLRTNEAARVGWQTLRFTWEEVVGDPRGVADTVRDVLAQRSSRQQPVPGG